MTEISFRIKEYIYRERERLSLFLFHFISFSILALIPCQVINLSLLSGFLSFSLSSQKLIQEFLPKRDVKLSFIQCFPFIREKQKEINSNFFKKLILLSLCVY